MYKIIYELNGEQQIAEVEESGGICSDATIIWDERIDGEIPEDHLQYVSGLVREDDNKLVLDLDKKDAADYKKEVELLELSAKEGDRVDCMKVLKDIDNAKDIEALKQCIKALAYTIGVM